MMTGWGARATGDGKPTRALIVGGDGAIGASLLAVWKRAGWRVDGSTRRPGADVGAPRVDLDTATWGDVIGRDYEVAVFCAAVARIGACEADPELTRRINLDNPLRLARALASEGARVIFLSTDRVFDGSIPGRRAGDPPCPTTVYGQQKAAAEAGILELPGAAVIRLTKVIWPGLALFDEWAEKLRSDIPIEAFTDLVMAPLAMSQVVDAITVAARLGVTGIFQLSGPLDIDYAVAAAALARILRKPKRLVRRVSGRAAGLVGGPPPLHSTLDTSRSQEILGFTPTDPIELLEMIHGTVPTPALSPGRSEAGSGTIPR